MQVSQLLRALWALGRSAKQSPIGKLCNLIAAELMIGFWFGIGAILAIKMVSSLEELISRKC